MLLRGGEARASSSGGAQKGGGGAELECGGHELRQTAKRGFSLTRSLSFARSRDHQLEAGERVAVAEAHAHLRSSQPRKDAAPSLFRSKSMRMVPSGADGRASSKGAPKATCVCDNAPQTCRSRPHTKAAAGQQQQQQLRATIDYLADAQIRHRRTLSTRRNSLLAFGKEEMGGGGAGGRLALFLRKLFSIRKRQSDTDKQGSPCCARCSQHQDPVQHHHRYHFGANDGHEEWRQARTPAYRTDETLGSFAPHHQRHQGRRPRKHYGGAAAARSPTAPTDSSSSPANSLIEILDCSPAMRDSRRQLRLEESRGGADASGQRARKWQHSELVQQISPVCRRSESSLSQHSTGSCSTIHSTASQQLRRHLDEAYRRHRKCTNQKEKEFIDSINVLRQASRHALDAPSSIRAAPAKTNQRQQATVTSASRAATAPEERPMSSAPQSDKQPSPVGQGSRSPSSFYGGGRQLDASEHSARLVEDHFRPDDLSNKSEAGETAPTGGNGDEDNSASAAHIVQQRQLSPGAPATCYCPCPVTSSPATATSSPLCQLGYCPTNALREPPSTPLQLPPLPPCCLAIQQRLAAPLVLANHGGKGFHLDQQKAQSAALLGGANNGRQQIALQPHNEQPLPSPSADDPFNCPLWRSMVFTYCQQQFMPPLILPPPPSTSTSTTASQSEPAPQLTDQKSVAAAPTNHLFASSTSLNQLHHSQQQQHNTTIDLKIEIGADFLEQQRKRNARQSQRSKLANENCTVKLISEDGPESELDVELADDSLDLSAHGSDGTLCEDASSSSSSSSGIRLSTNQIAKASTATDEHDRRVGPLKGEKKSGHNSRGNDMAPGAPSPLETATGGSSLDDSLARHRRTNMTA